MDAIQEAKNLQWSFIPAKTLVDTGLVQFLVTCLEKYDNAALQAEAAAALANAASASAEHARAIGDADAIPRLIDLVTYIPPSGIDHEGLPANEDLREQSLLALVYIMSTSSEFRDVALSLGIVYVLRTVIGPDTPNSLLSLVALALCNLCEDSDSPLPEEVIAELIPILSSLISRDDDEEIVFRSATALSYITRDGNVERIQMLIEHDDLVRDLLRLLSCQEERVLETVLAAARNIANADPNKAGYLLAENILSHISALLMHSDPAIVEATLGLVSDIIRQVPDQINQIVDEGIVPQIIFLTKDRRVQEKAIYAIRDLLENGDSHLVSYLVVHGVVPSLCNQMLDQNPNVYRAVLRSLFKVLVMAGEDYELIKKELIDFGGVRKIKEVDVLAQENHEMSETILNLLSNDGKDDDFGIAHLFAHDRNDDDDSRDSGPSSR